jgi:hypothetical protein
MRTVRIVLAASGLALAASASLTGLRAQSVFWTENPRGGDTPVFVRPDAYDYTPSVLKVGGTYHMWWCGSWAGDALLHAQSASIDGPWHSAGSPAPNTYDVTLTPTPPDRDDFDSLHTCDPSVIKVGAWFYVYYSGDTAQGAIGQNTNYKTCACDGNSVCGQDQCDGTTRIGVARSLDGLSWQRLNGGLPIVQPAWARPWAKSERQKPSPYGAGQPSVSYVDGQFYLIYTDTTGADTEPVSGAGQFVLRSADPAFQDGVEELACQQRDASGACTAAGFVPRTPQNHTRYSLLPGFSVDWQYVDALDAFLVASNQTDGFTDVWLFGRSAMLAGQPMGHVTIAGSWADGSGVVSTPDRHALPGAVASSVAVDLLRAVGPDIIGWDIAHNGADLRW